MKKSIAVDLGAESGRVIVGDVGGIDIVYRFANCPVKIGESLFWDILSIFKEIKEGMKIAFAKYPGDIVSIGIDAWGVDFALLDKNGDLMGNPYYYRDSRTDRMMESVFRIIKKEELYKETGIQMMQINSIFQLYSFFLKKQEVFNSVKYFLTIPDLLNYWLTGTMANEYSIASTTQLFNPVAGKWSGKILNKLGINEDIFLKPIIKSGTRLGRLLPSVAEETGAGPDVVVIAPACHDTASAVAAVPCSGKKNYAYLSSGTWSLLGIEVPEPVITEISFKYNFTNEGAADGGIRLLKNIMGLWILQECKKTWDCEDKIYSYDDLMVLAEENAPAGFKIDPNDPVFLKPGAIDNDMPYRIREYCKKTGQHIPCSVAEITRGIFESLADAYARVITETEEISDKKIEELYIIGGGSKNSLLCKITAEKLRLPVFAGPVEATAIGNMLMQMVALGELDTIEQGRKIIRESYKIKEYSA